MMQDEYEPTMVYCSFSGGLDSTTMVTRFLEQARIVRPVFFYYGSKHNDFELAAAKKVIAYLADKYAALLRPDLPVIDMRAAFAGTRSALMANDTRQIPDASYSSPGSLAETVVPGRNLIMASVLASMAESEARQSKMDTSIALGVHAGDHELYPDCRPDFLDRLSQTILASTDYLINLETPFSWYNKSDIVRVANEIGAPLHLTRSCYKMQEVSCGQCGTCRERLAAFAANGITDPIPYADEGK